ncbi:MAG: hypothetical protein MJ016_00245 [Victivallaceae bacterium]|nr:hypothetical protein [Victivallaceae bacterium]
MRNAPTVDRDGVGDCRVVRKKIASRGGGMKRQLLFLADLQYNGDAKGRRRVAALRDFLRREKISGIVISGDAVGDAVRLPEFSPFLAEWSREVDFAVASPGNWEQGKSWLSVDFWKRLYAEGGFDYLVNEGKSYDGIFIAGVASANRGIPRSVAVPPEAETAILLAHSADDVIYLDENDALADYRTALCGHFHGGQMRLPFFGALYIPSFYGRRFDQGVFRRDGAAPEIFVTRGAGELSCPRRFFCRREIAVLEIG